MGKVVVSLIYQTNKTHTMNAQNNIPAEISQMPIVRETIAAIRIMMDCSFEKPLYNRANWLDGIDAEYEKVISLLFSSFAQGEETCKDFCKRIAS